MMQVEPNENIHAMNALLIDEIDTADGFISFAEFMHHALYASDLGYYTNSKTKFGVGGDFVTAPEISPLFGRVIARQIAQVHDLTGTNQILELGAGTGRLAETILQALRDDGRTVNYAVLEASRELAAQQFSRLSTFDKSPDITVQWLESFPSASFGGVIIANEVLDALPVERFKVASNGIRQIGVTREDRSLVLAERPAPEQLRDAIREVEQNIGRSLPIGYCSEISLALKPWVTDLAASLSEGLVLFSDYGFGRREYYAETRTDGTLLCHLQHRAHTDVLLCPGNQDMTAWVDFTAVAEAGTDAGLSLSGFCSQALFLIGAGIADELARTGEADPSAQLQRASEVKTLTLPGEMGERFRFMGLTRGIIAPLSGFLQQDLRYQL